MRKAKEVCIGDKFGKWTIIQDPIIGNGDTKVLCQCECGIIKEHILSRLAAKTNPRFGCVCLFGKSNKKHGLWNSKLYSIYMQIKARCCNVNNPAYEYYGGRGITICDEWLNNSKSFFDWAMANGYQKDLEIDRIDNNLGYSPGNCRWITHQQNVWNMGSNKNTTSKYKGVY